MIDYTNKFNFAIQFNLVLIFGVQTAVFLSLYIISTIKHTICNKLMQENLQCNKKQNWIIKIFWIYLYCSWIPHIVIKDQYGTFLLECYPNFSVFFSGVFEMEKFFIKFWENFAQLYIDHFQIKNFLLEKLNLFSYSIIFIFPIWFSHFKYDILYDTLSTLQNLLRFFKANIASQIVKLAKQG